MTDDMITIDNAQKEIMELATEKNFPKGMHDVPFLLSKVSIELAEASEAWWDGGPTDHFKEELADVFIQLVQLFGVVESSASEEFRKKMDTNWKRDWSKKQKKSDYKASS